MRGSLLLTLAVMVVDGPSGELAPPVRVEAAGRPIDTEVGHACPFFGDFDGDGVPDLLVGQFGECILRIYRNEAKFGSPKLAASLATMRSQLSATSNPPASA